MNQINAVQPDMSFGKKSFISVVCILAVIIILVTILTYVIPAGTYVFVDGEIVEDSYHQIDSQTRLKWWQIPFAPIMALIYGQGNSTIIQVMVLLLALGGSFAVMEKSGGMMALVRVLLDKFASRKKMLIWVVTLFMMLLAASFGLQEELLIMFPIFLVLAQAMNWSNRTAISLILLTTGVGFTTALTNPLTIGTASRLAEINMLDGIWYRAVIFVFYFVFTSLYLIRQTKKDEAAAEGKGVDQQLIHQLSLNSLEPEERADTVRKAYMFIVLFAVIFVMLITASIIPALDGLGMVLMGATFIIGTFALGTLLMKGFKNMIKAFGKGVVGISPALIFIILAFSIKYIAESGDILHTIFYHLYNMLSSKSPYIAILIINVLVLVIEFFIPGVTGKAVLLIPLLTLMPIAGLSKNIIVLAFLFGDGFTNVFFPTCATLMVGLSLAKVSFVDWIKHTAVFQLLLATFGCVFLLIGVAIGY